jgi:hypothetical protein
VAVNQEWFCWSVAGFASALLQFILTLEEQQSLNLPCSTIFQDESLEPKVVFDASVTFSFRGAIEYEYVFLRMTKNYLLGIHRLLLDLFLYVCIANVCYLLITIFRIKWQKMDSCELDIAIA